MKLPLSPAAYSQSNEAAARQAIEAADRDNFKKGQEVELARGERLILRSPNGSRFAVTVDNAGNLSTSPL